MRNVYRYFMMTAAGVGDEAPTLGQKSGASRSAARASAAAFAAPGELSEADALCAAAELRSTQVGLYNLNPVDP
jgi:hypothetical protein